MFDPIQKILLIDDQKVVRFTLKNCLLSFGDFHIVEAEDGRHARHCIDEHEFDLIFCDLDMPVENGIDVLQYLATMKFTKPVVLISSDDEDVLRACSLLAHQFNLTILGGAEKPITKEIVRAFLVQALDVINPKEVTLRPKLSDEAIKSRIDNGDLIAHFQPQIALETNTLFGVEALARIENAQGALIYPNQFIDVAEQSCELIAQLTKAVINDAFSKFYHLLQRFPHLTLSVNIGARALADQTFPHWLYQTATAYQIPPERVTCELTETAICKDPSLLTASLLRLRLQNFRLSIDDFGTGYASIGQLHALPFHELKIDRCFIKDCLTNLKSRIVVHETIRLAKSMGLLVVAEGVEHEGEVALLRSMQCDLAQGYYFSRPVRYEHLLASHWLAQANFSSGNQEENP